MGLADILGGNTVTPHLRCVGYEYGRRVFSGLCIDCVGFTLYREADKLVP
ncbi:MAG: hypothetical protein ACD_41C00098G0002 [uncultured bacterium]|nr:MAG: hypothetical protein ACD_41C00098G0002 [uncultured bacterium]